MRFQLSRFFFFFLATQNCAHFWHVCLTGTRQINVCFQPWYSHFWLTELKILVTNLFFYKWQTAVGSWKWCICFGCIDLARCCASVAIFDTRLYNQQGSLFTLIAIYSTNLLSVGVQKLALMVKLEETGCEISLVPQRPSWLRDRWWLWWWALMARKSLKAFNEMSQ